MFYLLTAKFKVRKLTVISCVALFFVSVFVLSAKAEVYLTPDGHSFEVNLVPDKTEVMLGEPIYLSFEVKNLSKVNLTFPEGGDYRNRLGRPESFSLQAIRSDGKKVAVPEIKFNFGGMIGFRKISAEGGIYAVRLFLPLWSPFDEVGTYEITCRKNLVIKNSSKNDDLLSRSQEGTPILVKTEIKVVPESKDKMQKVITFWGEELIKKDYTKSQEAIKALQYITDRRVAETLVKALENDFFFPAKDSVIRTLANFNNEKTFSAIISQMNDESNLIRSSVVDALSMSSHPKAFNYLLQMKNDKDKFVRIRVIQALGGRKTAESLKILKEMLTLEENKELIQYAEPYLKKENL